MVGEPQNSTSLHWIPLACFSATVRPAKVSLGSLRAVRIFRSHKERETREPLELQNVSKRPHSCLNFHTLKRNYV